MSTPEQPERSDLKPRATYYPQPQWAQLSWRVESRRMGGDRFGSQVAAWGKTLPEAIAVLETLEAMRLIEQTGARA